MVSIFDQPSPRLWPDKDWIFQPPLRGRLEPTCSTGGDSVEQFFFLMIICLFLHLFAFLDNILPSSYLFRVIAAISDKQ